MEIPTIIPIDDCCLLIEIAKAHKAANRQAGAFQKSCALLNRYG